MRARPLQICMAVLALIPVATGALTMWGLADPLYTPYGLPQVPVLDSNLRFLGGIWLALGLAMWAIVPRIEHLRLPVIAGLQGGVIGGALDMVADIGSLQRLPMGLVKELAYTDRRWPAAQEIARHPPVTIWGTKPQRARQPAANGLGNRHVMEAVQSGQQKRAGAFRRQGDIKGLGSWVRIKWMTACTVGIISCLPTIFDAVHPISYL